MAVITWHIFRKKKPFRTFYSPLTKLPVDSIKLKVGDIGWCSIAINSVFSTMQIVIVKSANGSITIKLTTFLNFSHAGQHSQMRKVSAKVYQHGGHFCLDSSSSEKQTTTKGKSKSLFTFQHLTLDCHTRLPSIVLVMTLAILWALCLTSGHSRRSINSWWVPPPASLYSVSVVSAWRGNSGYKRNSENRGNETNTCENCASQCTAAFFFKINEKVCTNKFHNPSSVLPKYVYTEQLMLIFRLQQV